MHSGHGSSWAIRCSTSAAPINATAISAVSPNRTRRRLRAIEELDSNISNVLSWHCPARRRFGAHQRLQLGEDLRRAGDNVAALQIVAVCARIADQATGLA